MKDQTYKVTNNRKNKYEIDMCNGSLMDKLISFSLPLMLSGILQLAFNAVDIIVVGRFTGSSALAAVGSTTALINVFTNLFIGISLGANVLAARFFAAGREKEMSETVHTAIAMALVSGIVMAFVGVFFARDALMLMDTPADVIGQSALYMRIYFVGMPFFMLYNYGAAILRAVGDTKRPLLFLVISGTVNALLNLFLVIAFDMGVAGVAIATVISQLISCVLVLRCLCLTQSCYQLGFSKLSIKKEYYKARELLRQINSYKSTADEIIELIGFNIILDKAESLNENGYYVDIMELLSGYKFKGYEEQLRIGYIANSYYKLGSIDKAINILKELFDANSISINNVVLLRDLLKIRISNNNYAQTQKDKDMAYIQSTIFWEEDLNSNTQLITDKIYDFIKNNK